MIDFLAIAEAATPQRGLRDPQILIVFSGREAFIDSPQSAFGGQLPSAREAKTTSSFLKSDQLTLTPDRVARSSQQGQQAQTTPENQSRLDGLVGLTQALDRAGILASVTSIDVSSSTEIVMVYENRITARMLNNVDFDRKMQVLESIVATLGETDRGSINMRANDRAIWSPES